MCTMLQNFRVTFNENTTSDRRTGEPMKAQKLELESIQLSTHIGHMMFIEKNGNQLSTKTTAQAGHWKSEFLIRVLVLLGMQCERLENVI